VLVAEACEYDRSFHALHPSVAAILNVEADHLDIYDDLGAIVEAFARFASLLPPEDGAGGAGGFLLINHDVPSRQDIAGATSATVQTIGFHPQADWRIEVDGPRVTLSRIEAPHVHAGLRLEWTQPIPGEHMAFNAAAAAVLAHRLGAGWDAIREGLESFRGLQRRMDWLGHRLCQPTDLHPRLRARGGAPRQRQPRTLSRTWARSGTLRSGCSVTAGCSPSRVRRRWPMRCWRSRALAR
jgi:UDP-N-acetylmuramate--alanine ligase